jgi:hypothetical protein
LNQEYGVLSYNCQHFADLIFKRMAESKNLQLDVYFDSAADQPSGTSGAGLITVAELLSLVHDLSSSDEILVKIEINKAPINSWQMMDILMYHLFIVFQTNEGTYWSIERWPTRFTTQ